MRTSPSAVLAVVFVLAGCGSAGGDGTRTVDADERSAVDGAAPADGGGADAHGPEPDGPEDATTGPGDLDPVESAGGDPGPPAVSRPDWLGTRQLPRRPDGFGEAAATPPELVDRRLPPPEHLPRSTSEDFEATVDEVPEDVAARSTWRSDCPVALDELRYVAVTFWGFDDRAHTGELLVNASVADELVGVFETLYDERFPIEEMRVVRREELDAPPTGDGNNTTAFVCRPGVGGATWSEHALGLAVDVNPFHNPYVRGELVLPELATAYLDRDDHRPGMIQPGDVVTEAFADIGWGWGGTWRSSKDWMHFSASGR